MDLSKILSISGKSGLFKLIAQTKTGLIVESLDDNKRFPTHPTDKVNNLEDITVYTTDKDLPLKEIFEKIFEKQQGGQSIVSKSDNSTLIKYFETILPEYDKERVYASDIKKIINWYNILQSKDLIKPEEEPKVEGEESKKENETTETSEKPDEQVTQ